MRIISLKQEENFHTNTKKQEKLQKQTLLAKGPVGMPTSNKQPLG